MSPAPTDDVDGSPKNSTPINGKQIKFRVLDFLPIVPKLGERSSSDFDQQVGQDQPDPLDDNDTRKSDAASSSSDLSHRATKRRLLEPSSLISVAKLSGLRSSQASVAAKVGPGNQSSKVRNSPEARKLPRSGAEEAVVTKKAAIGAFLPDPPSSFDTSGHPRHRKDVNFSSALMSSSSSNYLL